MAVLRELRPAESWSERDWPEREGAIWGAGSGLGEGSGVAALVGVGVEDDPGDSDEGSSMGGNGRVERSGRGLKVDATDGGVEEALCCEGGHSVRGGRLGIFSL